MRTRMYGGVTGKAGDSLPMSIAVRNKKRAEWLFYAYGSCTSDERVDRQSAASVERCAFSPVGRRFPGAPLRTRGDAPSIGHLPDGDADDRRARRSRRRHPGGLSPGLAL